MYLRLANAQAAHKCVDGNVDYIVAEAPAVGPAARNEATVAERILDFAFQNVAAEDTQSRETRIIRIGRVTRATARKARLTGGEIYFDQVGNVDRGDVGAVVRDARLAAAEQN